jgi:hypothetical protein
MRRKGRIWAVLLHLILLVTPNSPPAQPGLSSVNNGDSTLTSATTASWGVMTVKANLAGEALNDYASEKLKWGSNVSHNKRTIAPCPEVIG